MRNSPTECPGLHAGSNGLVDQAAAARDVLRWFQRRADPERQSVSAAAARVQGMQFGIIGSVFDGRPPPSARNWAHGSALLELRSPWRAGLSGKHARSRESVSVGAEDMGERL